jgi:2-succinyl-5-enolpyruvyl-6-hydroxy-3-cyclohexene-1-carboxylate synthase
MTNIAEARRVIEQACELGATDFCVCAGSRNSPLLAVLGASTDKSVCATSDSGVSTGSSEDSTREQCATPSSGNSSTGEQCGTPSSGSSTREQCGTDTPVCARDLRIFSFVDERSAAFFALGRAKLTERPVAVVTTSGTAVAELLPAAIEAHYSGTKLILITADRPARYRGTGAPQAIEQEDIFGVYARGCVTHINVEFDEQLIDEPPERRRLAGWPGGVPPPIATGRRDGTQPAGEDAGVPGARPLVLIGGLQEHDRDAARTFAQKLNVPIYAEPLSGLREDLALAHLLITAGERMIGCGDFDSVIRIGNVPALRFWRDLDESRRELPLVSFSALPFTGCSRGDVHPIEALPDVNPCERDERFFDDDRARAAAIARILDDEPDSELAMVRQLSCTIPTSSRVYLGNSLPIREWDLAATREPRGFVFEANRGANGIDGQLSTFFGQCDPSRPNICVVGDLTAIYDSNAPWIVPQLDAGIDFRVVIINNGGGRIFSRVPSLRRLDPAVRERMIENSHALRFEQWAAMWGIEDRVTELRPDAEASRRAWERYDALW